MMPAIFIVTTFAAMVRYEYFSMPNRLVAIKTEEHLILGKLSSDGEFKEVSRLPFQKAESGLSTLNYSGRPYTVLNTVEVVSENTVYELRKDLLVPGRLNWKGEFTADLKKESLPFEKYQFTPSAPPIWNLPGVFLPAGSKNPALLDLTGTPLDHSIPKATDPNRKRF